MAKFHYAGSFTTSGCGLDFLHKFGLRGQVFGKDLEKLFESDEDCTVFLVGIRPVEDELYRCNPRSFLNSDRAHILLQSP